VGDDKVHYNKDATAWLGVCVRAHMPVFGLIVIRMVIIGIQLQTWMRVIVDVEVSR